MLSLLHRFAALSLLLVALDMLLPRSTLRRTAMMCAGFIAALCWLDALTDALPQPSTAPHTALFTSTQITAGDPSAAEEVYLRQAERAYGE